MKKEVTWGGGIRRLRARTGLAQEELAERIDMVVETVRRIECGARASRETYEKIRSALCLELGMENAAEADAAIAYEGGIARQVTDAVALCEKEGLPLIATVLGESPNRTTERKDGGLPAAVVTCAETLERQLLSAVDNELHLTGAVVPTLYDFIAGPGELPLTELQCHALVRLIGSLVAGLIEPCSLDLKAPLIDVQDIGEGWLLQLAFNAHRGRPVTLSFDASDDPPALVAPGCAIQIPVHNSATDRRQADRKTLVSAHRVLKPAYELTGDWLEEDEESLDRLDFTSAYRKTDAAAYGRKDVDHAPFAYVSGADRRREYLRSLTRKSRLPSLPVIDKRERGGPKILRNGVDEEELEDFVRHCLQVVEYASERRDLYGIIDERGPERLIAGLREGMKELRAEDAEAFLQALREAENSSDRRAGLHGVLKRFWKRTGELAGHVRAVDTLSEKITEIVGSERFTEIIRMMPGGGG